jgi:hypothetical protein
MCSVLSNHQAPSRDIAIKISDLDRVKHILSGGYWREDEKLLSAGMNVTSLIFKSPILQRHLGWVPERPSHPGEVKYPPKSKKVRQPTLTTAETSLVDANYSRIESIVESTSSWLAAPVVTSATGDECQVGSWCVFCLSTDVVRILLC